MVLLGVVIALIVVVTGWMMRRVASVERALPLDNLPVIFLLMLALYTTLPPLLWMMQGGEYVSPLAGRLFLFQPTLAEQTYLSTLALLVTLGVAASQFLLPRRLLRTSTFHAESVPREIAIVCFSIICLQFLFMSFLFSTGVVGVSATYIDSYRVIQELPLLLRQSIKILGGLAFFAKLTLLVWFFQRWHTHRTWVYLFVLFTLVTVDPEAGRASVAITLFACVVLWNRYVKAISFTKFAVFGITAVVVFTVWGAYRGLGQGGLAGVGIFDIGAGEFDSLWANAVELYRDSLAIGTELPPVLLLSEFYGFIPSNILPFAKSTYSEWYLTQYYPQYQIDGGGLMFGLLAQLVVGFGAAEAPIRGIAVGLFLGWLTHYLSRVGKWWQYPSLLYCVVWSFQIVRDSSFALVTPLVQVVVVSVIAIGAVARLVPVSRTTTPLRPHFQAPKRLLHDATAVGDGTRSPGCVPKVMGEGR